MKKTTPKLVLSLLLLTGTTTIFGQVNPKSNQQLTPSGHIRCYTNENEEALQKENPDRATTEAFEAWLAPLVEKRKQDLKTGRGIQQVFNIPVVIHIVHNGDCIGTGENITDAQAQSQIDVLNQDYRRMLGTPGGANSTGLAVDCEINFCLAKKDPSGNPTTGIIRHNITPYNNNVADGADGPDWETRADVERMKTVTQWNPNDYLNMWCIRPGGKALADGGLSGLLGYAQFPTIASTILQGLTGGNANTDGVVAGFDSFGTIALNDGSFMLNAQYNLGRTMTHEVGHWLGLRHIWGDGSNCNTNNDFCNDTPVALAANYSCTSVLDSCPLKPGNDMTQNYMDYTNDSCMDTFTNDQKTRMVTVMLNAIRRKTLNDSNACTAPKAGIYLQKIVNKCFYEEKTNCTFTDVSYPISIQKAPTANAVVTFSADNAASTATLNRDFEILTPTVTFNAGSITSQDLKIRYYNDGVAESNEKVVVNFALNANGGDAALIADSTTLTVEIKDNDERGIDVTASTTLLNEIFETPTGWVVRDGDGDGVSWTMLTGLEAFGNIQGKTAASVRNRALLSGTGVATPDNYMISPAITISDTATAANLSYVIGAYCAAADTAAGGFKEHYTVYFTSNISSLAAIQSGTVLQAEREIPARGTEVRTHDMLPYRGQTGYIVVRHNNTFGTTPKGILLLDTVSLTSTVNTTVQTLVNNATKYEAILSETGQSFAKDKTSGNIMAEINTTTNHNYGCTTVAVTRDLANAGAAAVNFGANTANNLKVMAKSFTITPATINTTAGGNVKFFFTEAEIAAWEAATGNNRSSLRILKESGSVLTNTTLGTFGANNITLSGNYTNGLQGVYYFGIENALSNDKFELQNEVNIYPNPTTSTLNITISGDYTGAHYTIYNTLGQEIHQSDVKDQKDLKVNTTNFSNGVYFIKIIKDGAYKTLQFIKN